MDKATEYLILQEAEWSRVADNLKIMIPNIQSALVKPNINRLKLISKKLKGKKLTDIQRDATRKIPGFKKDFAEAQRKVPRLKFATAHTSRGIALATALVSSVTGRSVNEVMKKGEMRLRNAKVVSGVSFFQLIAFGLFVTFIISIFLADSNMLMGFIKAALQALALLVLIISTIIKALLTLLQKSKEAAAAKGGDAPDTPGGDAGGDAGSFWDAASEPSGIPGDIGLINPEAMMAWVLKSFGF